MNENILLPSRGLQDFKNHNGLENNIVVDLGLINHMGCYSDIIFQGFVGALETRINGWPLQ